MAKTYQRTLLIGLLTLAPLFGACEQVDISGVTESEAPAQDAAAKPKTVKLLLRHAAASGRTVAVDWVTAGKTTTLKLGKYELFVPRGAVKKPTTFRMTVLSGPVIGVSLEAWDNQGNRVTEFNVPLRLTLPYDEAHVYSVDDCKFLLANIVSETDHTILDVVNVGVNPEAQTITGNITHFSVWSLAKELSPAID